MNIENRNKVVEEYMNLVYWATKKYRFISDYDDLVSTVSMHLVQSVDRYKPNKGMTMKSWLISQVRWAAINYVRRNYKKPLRRISPHHACKIKEIDRLEILKDLCKDASQRTRIALILYFYEQMNIREVAKHLKVHPDIISTSFMRLGLYHYQGVHKRLSTYRYQYDKKRSNEQDHQGIKTSRLEVPLPTV